MRINHLDTLKKIRCEIIPEKLKYVNAMLIVILLKTVYKDDKEQIIKCYFKRRKILDVPIENFNLQILTTGLIYSRSLLEFLGLGYNRKLDRMIRKPKRPEYNNNINIADFGLPYVTPDQLNIDENKMYKWVFEYTNRSIAHITDRSFFLQLPDDIFMIGAYLPRLYTNYFFSNFSDPIPDYHAVDFYAGKDLYYFG